MLFVGYGAMILETLLGVISLIVVGAVAVGGKAPEGAAGISSWDHALFFLNFL